MNKTSNLKASILLIVTIVVAWLISWLLIKNASLNGPLPGWSGDVPAALAWVKAYSNGTFLPFTQHFNPSLNAPYVANWNDFPGEDLTLAVPGLWMAVFGFGLGINLYMLCLHIANGLSFFLVARTLQYGQIYSAIGGLIFAFSPLMFFRSIAHLTVTTVWHIPLMLLALMWIWSPAKVSLSPKQGLILSLITCVLAGVFNPYYTCIFIFLLAIAWACQILSNDRASQKTLIFIWIVFATAILVRLNYFLFASSEGGNPEALGRALSTLVSVSLNLPDLILSPAHNPIWPGLPFPVGEWYSKNIPEFMRGESQMSYIGIIPAIGLAMLFGKSTLLIFSKQAEKISEWFWLALSVFAFSITGGIIYLLGAFGFLMLRSNNRFSVFLLLIGLFYLCEILSQKQFKKRHFFISVFAVFFMLWDQIPAGTTQIFYLQEGLIPHTKPAKNVVESLDVRLPKDAMVFQLPVHPFPETSGYEKMGDYDQFLPYLYSNNLRFSYGSMKGREDSAWQARVTRLPLTQMLQRLEAYGFSALLINRDAYPDQAVGMVKELNSLGYRKIVDEGNLVAFALNPSTHPISPAPEWEIHYGVNFSKPETDEKNISHWIKGDEAIIEVKRPWYIKRTPGLEGASSKELTLNIGADANCGVTISSGDKPLQSTEIASGREVKLILQPNAEGLTQYKIKKSCQSSGSSVRIIQPLIR